MALAYDEPFDRLGTPLCDVTFCVLDLETTGGNPGEDQITEIGAVKVRGGEWLGTFHTLVNPGRAIPPAITYLTGITQAMVTSAPRIQAVLPSLAEFVQRTVIVGHNVRFDLGFLQAAFARHAWPRLANRAVDTVALARRLVRDEVPDCRLGTLAERFRLDHRPSHRALDDALATTDLLHLLLERAAAWGVLGLDDLLALPRIGGHPQVAKLRLTTTLPRLPGVYWFVDARGVPLYVGKAANLRQRVRSYFSGDDRRKIGNLLRETAGIRHHVTASTLESAVIEARLIHRLEPRYNRQGTGWRKASYVALTLGERYPRLKVARTVQTDGSLYVGPIRSAGQASTVVEAIQAVVPLRRCTEHLGPRTALPRRADPCLAAQLGVARCPCAGEADGAEYARLVAVVVEGLRDRPEALLEPLRERMDALARIRRFEEAALVRDRAGALVAVLGRQRRLDALRAAGRLRLRLEDGTVVDVDGGIYVGTEPPPERVGSRAGSPPSGGVGQHALPLDLSRPGPGGSGPLVEAVALEVATVAGWLDREAHRVRLEHCEGTLASPWPALPSFEPGRATGSRREDAA